MPFYTFTISNLVILCLHLVPSLVHFTISFPSTSNWLPLLSVLTFLLAPLPNAICKRASSSSRDFLSDDSDRGILDAGYFVTSFLVVSGIALPIVLNHSAIITDLALILSLCGGILIYITILGYQHFFVDQPYETY
ncbi:hypothetical protein BSLG_001174 [Batrachochytrium salamandrivorans]|nr:hypothetical protein BSLG_001174 [Batrachochytrium salamandrivorans]